MSALAELQSFIARGQRARELDLSGTVIDDVDLSSVTADRLTFTSASLGRTIFGAARITASRFDSAHLEDANFSGATLRGCNLDSACALNASFAGARLEDSTAVSADFSHANFRRAHLTETSFARAVMRRATLDDAEGEGVEFRGADLADATLVGARFDDGDFRGADLRRANLSHGRFRSADFRGALLEGTVFDGADVSGASFDAGASPFPAAGAEGHPGSEPPGGDPMMATLEALLAQAPALLTAPDGISTDLIDCLHSIGQAMSAAAVQSPADWTAWAERLVALGRADGPTDAAAMLNTLIDGPIARAVEGGTHARGALEPLRAAALSLAAATDGPPAEWQPILTTLMEMSCGKRPVDLKALLEELRVAPGHTSNTRPRE